ncbi:MAG: GTPase ObgE [Spirochaetia bacterium]|nr:GTPase ObgE [Spirochaetia bacterium]
MHKFIDEIFIRVKSGDGGPGAVSFRHEKYIEFGGPDGGNGGAGGNIYIQADSRIINLAHLKRNRLYKAGNGDSGKGRQRSGKNGQDLIINVPLGTVITSDDDVPICDLTDETPYLLVTGGMGGKGNAFFKSSTNQAPRHFQPGISTEEFTIKLSLKMIADVGLVGLPNSGKSTLLKTITHASPKIANYPFTTLSPNLGTLEVNNFKQCIIADIPGIIEGASMGHGLGLSFLKHIERVRVLIFVLDITMAHVDDELNMLRRELDSYNPVLNQRPSILVFNKIDLIEEAFLNEWIESFRAKGQYPIPISGRDNINLDKLIFEISKYID